VQSWDTANKPSELADYSVCTTWGLKEDRIYLLDVYREKVNFPDLERAVYELRNRWNATAILIEDRASGTALIQTLRTKGIPVVEIQPTTDKTMRFHAQTAVIENGFVYLPAQAPWRDDYLHELMTFPKGRYDDQVDSTAQALTWIKAGRSFFEYDMGWTEPPFSLPFLGY
jgi:predicted phage terminase large subunit-like protein